MKSIIPLMFTFNIQVLFFPSLSKRVHFKMKSDLPLVFDYKNFLRYRDMAKSSWYSPCIYSWVKIVHYPGSVQSLSYALMRIPCLIHIDNVLNST